MEFSSQQFSGIPKAELHVHLEGSLRPPTLQRLRAGLTEQEIREKLAFSDFGGFLQAFIWMDSFLDSPEAYAAATSALADELAAQRVIYAEIILSAGVIQWKGLPLDEVFGAVQAASRRSDLEIHWILDAVRQWGFEPATKVVEFAVKHSGSEAGSVVGFGIGGDEKKGPVTWFKDHFRYAKQNGLIATPHAGETDGPASMWAALEAGADRIGHGFRAVEDPELVQFLAKQQIPLEICVSSNLKTGAWHQTTVAHPARQLFLAGVPVTVNTDDPGIFGPNLNQEATIWLQHGFNQSELEQILSNSYEYRADRLS
jgi:aminodeoxyfutalosine deaminase